jgi:hypothetical protein
LVTSGGNVPLLDVATAPAGWRAAKNPPEQITNKKYAYCRICPTPNRLAPRSPENWGVTLVIVIELLTSGLIKYPSRASTAGINRSILRKSCGILIKSASASCG